MEQLLFNADVLKGAAQQLPILVVMWWMLKDVQKHVHDQKKELDDVKKALHAETVARLEAQLDETRRLGDGD